ncbi:hypothetical protein STVA_11490 [Allostella vacuolata]|nr:hypothetical protein STVA_11490 [Stella vacuolata]
MRPPAQRGFGLDLVEREVSHNLLGHSQIDFTPQGLSVSIDFVARPDRGSLAIG